MIGFLLCNDGDNNGDHGDDNDNDDDAISLKQHRWLD